MERVGGRCFRHSVRSLTRAFFMHSGKVARGWWTLFIRHSVRSLTGTHPM